MKISKHGITLAAIAGWVAIQALASEVQGDPAQGRGERAPGRPSPDGGPGEPPPPPPPAHPLFLAIDDDLDGELSAREIAKASDAILRLDRNKDGILTEDEVRPPRPRRGPEGRPGRPEARPEFGPGRFGGPGGGGPGRPGRPGGPGEVGPGPQGNPEAFVDSVLEFDKDGDGKVTATELPDRRARLIEEGDVDGDNALDGSEIETLSRRPPPRRPGPPGGGPPPSRGPAGPPPGYPDRERP
ncbi:hypothetical protein P12x_002776 [Tundrisphaera lichenicola]|uniref:hypothetical protein n=1 Tax=Tundrisphaera lichenicola TaxID=2029860 RepID=UPI003EBCED09